MRLSHLYQQHLAFPALAPRSEQGKEEGLGKINSDENTSCFACKCLPFGGPVKVRRSGFPIRRREQCSGGDESQQLTSDHRGENGSPGRRVARVVPPAGQDVGPGS